MRASAQKCIVLITEPGRGTPLIEKLFAHGLTMLDLHHARGSAIGGPIDRKGVPVVLEQEIVTCVVAEQKADEVFALIHELGKVDQPGGGFMYMQDLARGTQMSIG